MRERQRETERAGGLLDDIINATEKIGEEDVEKTKNRFFLVL